MSKTYSAEEAVDRGKWYTGQYITFENKNKIKNPSKTCPKAL